jgi:hypothetical protein
MFLKKVQGIEITKLDCNSPEYGYSCANVLEGALRLPSWTDQSGIQSLFVQVFEKEGPDVEITKLYCTSQECSHSCAGL